VFLNCFFGLWRRTKVKTKQAEACATEKRKGDHAMKPESMMNSAGLVVTTPTERETL